MLSSDGGVGAVEGVENLTSSMHLGDPSLSSLLGFLTSHLFLFLKLLYSFLKFVFLSSVLKFVL